MVQGECSETISIKALIVTQRNISCQQSSIPRRTVPLSSLSINRRSCSKPLEEPDAGPSWSSQAYRTSKNPHWPASGEDRQSLIPKPGNKTQAQTGTLEVLRHVPEQQNARQGRIPFSFHSPCPKSWAGPCGKHRSARLRGQGSQGQTATGARVCPPCLSCRWFFSRGTHENQ